MVTDAQKAYHKARRAANPDKCKQYAANRRAKRWITKKAKKVKVEETPTTE